MNITLHKATEAVRDLLDQIDPETGEMPDGFEEARTIVQNKAVAVTAYIVEAGKSIESAKDYVKELQAKIKTAEKRQAWLEKYLQDHMAAIGITSIEDERGIFKATLQPGRDEAIEIFDEAQLPALYMREIPAKQEPDKTLIKKAIKDGHDVPGAKLIKRDRLTIK